jgi:hypothetical protein
MHDQRGRAAIAQDVTGLVRLEVPVDGAKIATGGARDQHRLQERDIIAQHGGDDLALSHAERLKAADAAHRSLQHGSPVQPPFARDQGRDHAFASVRRSR